MIFPDRDSNGCRDRGPSTIDRVRAVRSLLDAGLPVRFVKRLLPRVVDGAGDLDAHARDEISAYHGRLSQQITVLERQRTALGEFLAHAPDGETEASTA